MRCFTVTCDNDIVPGFKVVLDQYERPFVLLGSSRLSFNNELVESAVLSGTHRLLRADIVKEGEIWRLCPERNDDSSVLVLFGSNHHRPYATGVIGRQKKRVQHGEHGSVSWESWLLARVEIGQSIGFEKPGCNVVPARPPKNLWERIFGVAEECDQTTVYEPLAVYDGKELKLASR